MNLCAGVTLEQIRCGFRPATENIDPLFFEPRQSLAGEMPRPQNENARAMIEARASELAVRASAETGQVIGADTLRIGDQPLNPRCGAAPPRTLLRTLREPLELPEDFRLAEDRRVKTADDFEQKGVAVFAQMKLILCAQLVGTNLSGVEDGNLAKAGLPDEGTRKLGREIAAWSGVDYCD